MMAPLEFPASEACVGFVDLQAHQAASSRLERGLQGNQRAQLLCFCTAG